jgi:hypothetical protein
MSNLVALAWGTQPSSAELEKSAAAASAMADSFEIVDQTTYELAAEELRDIKSKIKSLTERRMAITSPLTKAHAEVMALFKPAELRLLAAEKAMKSKLISYSDRIEREAAAARAAADEENRAAAARAAQLAAEADALLARASETELAAAATNVVQISAPKAAGISKVKVTFKARVVDKRAFIEYALSEESGVCMEMIEVDEKPLSSIAKATGGAMKIPGVEVYEEKSIAARS